MKFVPARSGFFHLYSFVLFALWFPLVQLVACETNAQDTGRQFSSPVFSTTLAPGSIYVTPTSTTPIGTAKTSGVFPSQPRSNTLTDSSSLESGLESGCDNTGTQIQLALDGAYAAGGGTVNLSRGVYCIDQPLIVRSGVSIIGAGVGATVLRGKAGPYVAGTYVDGAEAYATIAAVAADGVMIRGLTVDHATNGTWANGISLLPNGEGYTGTPCTRCVVENVSVLGAGNQHAYMIWNLRGDHNKIINNWVDGGVATYVSGSNQEGIESFGGTNILISGNTVRNVGYAGINICSVATVPDSGFTGVSVVDNYIANCGVGVSVGPAYDDLNGSQEAASTHVKNNVIIGALQYGILSTIRNLTVNRDLQIRGNTVKDVGTVENSGFGIVLYGDPTTAVTPGTVVSNVVSDNNVENTLGVNGIGIGIFFYPNVQILMNKITASRHSGIFFYVAHDIELNGNKITDSGYYGVFGYSSKRQIIKNNNIRDWANAGAAAGIEIQGSESTAIQGNSFYFDNAQELDPSAIRVEQTSSPAVIQDNALLYQSKISRPFVNLSTNPNRGQFKMTKGSALMTVNNDLVTSSTRVAVTQTAGVPVPFTVASNPGYFVVTLTAPSNAGAEAFIYEIFP